MEPWMTSWLGVPLDQRSWAVVPNAIQLAARGALVLAIGALITPVLPTVVREVMARLGRGSLVAYVFHVPLCYGALARPIAGRLTMLEATGVVLVLEVLSFGAVVLRDVVVARRTVRSAA
jgi:hypothetical protein